MTEEENKIITINLINESKKIIDEVESKEKETGENFNIFQTLNLATDEVRISSLIAEFLNPLGTHKQGYKYLDIFLEILYEKNPNFVNERFTKEDISKDARVSTEQFHIVKNIGSRIDIIIENDKYAIVIENKIEAGDQDNQLWRYYQSKKDKKVMLVYLTKNGDNPNKKSNTLKSKDNDISLEESQITCLSYHFDILKWLSNCNDKNNPKNIGIIMEHLARNIRKITNQVDKNMENSLVKLLLKDDNFKIANEISKVVPIVKAEKTYDFFMTIKNELDKNKLGFQCVSYKLEKEPNENEWDWIKNDKSKLLELIQSKNIQSSQKKQGIVRLFYQDTIGNIIYVADGFFNKYKGIWIGVKSNNQEKANIKKEFTLRLCENGVYEILDSKLFQYYVSNIVSSTLNIMEKILNEDKKQ
ncbi:MAG: PD-(D/E)XK nuclease family protein [Arcobacteraceae bacterium]